VTDHGKHGQLHIHRSPVRYIALLAQKRWGLRAIWSWMEGVTIGSFKLDANDVFEFEPRDTKDLILTTDFHQNKLLSHQYRLTVTQNLRRAIFRRTGSTGLLSLAKAQYHFESSKDENHWNRYIESYATHFGVFS
jgi:hypothetical protein